MTDLPPSSGSARPDDDVTDRPRTGHASDHTADLTVRDPGSFRDPGGHVFIVDGQVYRTLDTRSLTAWKQLAATDFFAEQQRLGTIVTTDAADPTTLPEGLAAGWAGLLHHERVPVVSYPYEWTFGMLQDAALLQLDLLEAALAEDMILKDSTPYNVQWHGPSPVFIDVGSFEPIAPGDLWVGYRQFLQQYLYPLLLRSHVGVPFQPWMRGRPDGITADEMWNLLSGRDKLRKTTLLHVGMPARAERHYDDENRDVRTELKEAGFKKELIQTNVRGLRSTVAALQWDHGDSEWNRYAMDCDHVSSQRQTKSDFLAQTLAETAPTMVWDVGANDGYFSRQAAVFADYVLALDADEVVVDELYRSLKADGTTNVLPLLQDLSDPSPGLGWRGTERTSLEHRASPDLVLCFAVIHHLVIGKNVPLRQVIEWLAGLDSRVILEFVPPSDPMVLKLTANKRAHEVHTDYNEDALRGYLDEHFVIDREEPVPAGDRRLFALRPIA